MNNKKKFIICNNGIDLGYDPLWMTVGEFDEANAVAYTATDGKLQWMEVKLLKGMSVSVYRDADGGDCTLGGISSKYKRLILVGACVPEIFEETEDCPSILLKIHMGQPIAVPDTDKWTMMGGNFLYTCDSRFRENVNPYPIRIHDRIEG
jgi:hypothetical protein